MRRSQYEKMARQAKTWPVVAGEVNHWKVISAGENADSFSTGYQIEAGFHFTLNGEYYGGYFLSIPMGMGEAERLGQGTPAVQVRYDPGNPDSTVVLPEDNIGTLPFAVFSGLSDS